MNHVSAPFNSRFAILALCALLPGLAMAAETQPVDVVETTEQPVIDSLRVSGTVTSPHAAMLSPSIGGLIAAFDVDAGDVVAAGDRLVRLDPELESLALDGARASESEARAALADAQRRFDEAQRLGTERGIAESEVKSRQAEVAMREAALQAAQASVREYEARLRRHELRAPFDGVVSRRLSAVGEWVNPGTGLLELVATKNLRFDFRVPQDYFPRISNDTRVTLRLDAQPDREFDGRIQAIVPVSDPTARTFLLRATTDDDDVASITPGMSANADIHIDTGRTAIVVPRDAVLRYPDGRTTVWVVNDDEDPARATERIVKTGLEFDSKVEIRDGLEAGKLVVTRGNESLQADQPVRIR